MSILDMYGNNLKDGDIIDIGQTVNGENLFFLNDLSKKDIRYFSDLKRKYQYDFEELLDIEKETDDKEIEIVGYVEKGRLRGYCL